MLRLAGRGNILRRCARREQQAGEDEDVLDPLVWPQQTQVRAYYSDPFWPGYHGYWWGHYHRPIVVRSVAPRSTESPPAKQ